MARMADKITQISMQKQALATKIIELLIDNECSYAEAERMLDLAKRMLKTYIPSKKRDEKYPF